MDWHFLDTGSLTGEQNMNFDISLAKNCLPHEAFFRLYRWDPYTISLGKNQSFDEIDLKKAALDNLDVVKRPTGGRAILHAEEITYSVVVPISIELSAKELYQKISIALIRGLQMYDNTLQFAELESVQPNFNEVLKEASGGLCFASTAKNEVKFEGKKVIGSAQRKLSNVILQHGSILCGTFHKRLPEYFLTDEKTRDHLRNELGSRTIELETILNTLVDYKKLKEALAAGFQKEFAVIFKEKKILESEEYEV